MQPTPKSLSTARLWCWQSFHEQCDSDTYQSSAILSYWAAYHFLEKICKALNPHFTLDMNPFRPHAHTHDDLFFLTGGSFSRLTLPWFLLVIVCFVCEPLRRGTFCASPISKFHLSSYPKICLSYVSQSKIKPF